METIPTAYRPFSVDPAGPIIYGLFKIVLDIQKLFNTNSSPQNPISLLVFFR